MRKQLLNDYFGFNKQQRRGLLVLCTLSFLVLLVRLVYPYFLSPSQVHVQWINLQHDSTTLSVQRSESPENKSFTAPASKIQFDPNTADLSQLLAAGLPKKTASTLLNFRSKGFRVKEKKDLLKVYGFSADLLKTLEAQIIITRLPEKETAVAKTEQKTFQKIELNAADTTELKTLLGIGSVLSKRIVAYRTKLGGFYSTQQLTEVYGISSALCESLCNKVIVDSTKLQVLYPNLADFKTLSKHPYIGYELSKTLCALREKESLTAAKIQTLMANAPAFERLRHYLAFVK